MRQARHVREHTHTVFLNAEGPVELPCRGGRRCPEYDGPAWIVLVTLTWLCVIVMFVALAGLMVVR